MFEEYLCAKTMSSQGALGAEPYVRNMGEKDRSKVFLEELKNDDKLALLAEQLVATKQDLDDSKRHVLQNFFSETLQCRPDDRAADLRRPFTFLALNL